MLRNADKGVQEDVDGSETAAVALRKGRIIGRVDKAFVVHPVRITKQDWME
jgi:hypothetical protein